MKLWREPTDAEIFADDVVWDETGFVPVEPDYRPLADALHHELCKLNHTDGCSYYYHQWSDELPDWHPKHKWLKKAEEVFGTGIGETP